MASNYNLTTFKAISTFTKELAELYDKEHHPLKLYVRLLNKTTISHEKAIQKHIEAFRKFCVDNREQLLEKNKELASSKVLYSSRVYIDFSVIFKLVNKDKDIERVIWDHLLTISALVDPSGKAKEILKNESKSNETDFLSNIIEQVEDKINPNASNPMEAVSQILSSGVFTDLLSGMNTGMKDGSLDLGKMMNTVQKMCSKMNVQNKEGGGDTMNLINSLVGNMTSQGGGGGGGGGGGTPDIANLMSSLVGNMTSQGGGASGGGGGGGTPDIANLMSSFMKQPPIPESPQIVSTVIIMNPVSNECVENSTGIVEELE